MRYGEMIRPREVGRSGGGDIGHGAIVRAAYVVEGTIVRPGRSRCRWTGVGTQGKDAAVVRVICQNPGFWYDLKVLCIPLK